MGQDDGCRAGGDGCPEDRAGFDGADAVLTSDGVDLVADADPGDASGLRQLLDRVHERAGSAMGLKPVRQARLRPSPRTRTKAGCAPNAPRARLPVTMGDTSKPPTSTLVTAGSNAGTEAGQGSTGGTPPSKEMLRALDEWIDQAQAADHPLFATEAERMAAFYAARKRSRRRWENGRHECMFPGCAAPSIRRSHTLPRSGPLSLIAEDGHLVTPQVVDGDQIRVLPVGIGEASTFPGFCTTHEGEFREIDLRKDVDGHRSWLLQFFRTICWEVRILKHQRASMRAHAHQYESGLLAQLNAFLAARFGAESYVTKLTGLDWRQELMETELKRMDALIASYEQDFLEPLRAELAGKDVGTLSGLVIELPDIMMPVCLAGRGNFHCDMPEGAVTVPVFLQVFPSLSGTKVGMLAAGNSELHLKSYIAHYAKLNLAVVDTVEAWMIHGTDHWFLRPSVWNDLPPERRERLEAEFLDKALSIGEPTRDQIFDRSRMPLVKKDAPA
jgi:hypothetical protein